MRSKELSSTEILSRRQWLKLGVLSFGGVSVPLSGPFWMPRAQAGESTTNLPARIRSCIVIFYYGGPSHLDTFDMKPDVPAEIRGEFQSIPTTVPDLRICEHLPYMAKVMHKVAVVRSMHHTMRFHDSGSYITLTGRVPLAGDRENFAESIRNFPSFGACLSRLWESRGLPVCHAALPYVMNNDFQNPGQTPGFLGTAYSPFLIEGDPDALRYNAEQFRLPAALTQTRLSRRRNLLGALDELAREAVDERIQTLHRRAFELLAADEVRRAVDIEREDPKVRERYGLGNVGQGFIDNSFTPGGPQDAYARNLRGQNLLLARRLVEAGVPYINVYDYKQQGLNWDTHSNNFEGHRQHLLPAADRALSALIEDLDARGLLDSTLVVAVGEFGRTPKINKNAGRDHWPDCYTAVLAGGGVKGGYVFGASDKNGAYPDRDPVTPADLGATIFHAFGVDPASEIHDPTGRPWRITEGLPIRGLLS